MRTGTVLLMAVGSAALVGWPGQGSAQPAGGPSLADIVARWRQRQDATQTFRIAWTQTVFYPKGACSAASPRDFAAGEVFPSSDATLDERGLVAMDGEKARLERAQKTVNTFTKGFTDLDIHAVYDGKTGALLSDRGGSHKRMSRQSAPTPPMLLTSDTSPFLAAFRPLEVDVGGYDPDLFRTTGRSVVVNGARCVEVASVRSSPTAGCTLWLDPARDYHVVRFQQYGVARYALIQFDVDYVPDGPERWRPAGWVSVFQLHDGRLHRRVKATVTECEVGGRVASTAFSTVPPPNTRVEDYPESGAPSEFVVRPDGSRREVLPEERFEPFDVLVRTEPGEPLGRPVRSWWGRNWMVLLGCGAAAAGLAGLVAVVRWRR